MRKWILVVIGSAMLLLVGSDSRVAADPPQDKRPQLAPADTAISRSSSYSRNWHDQVCNAVETRMKLFARQDSFCGKKLSVTVQYTVMSNGCIKDVRVLKNSANVNFDREMIRALCSLSGSTLLLPSADFHPDEMRIESCFTADLEKTMHTIGDFDSDSRRNRMRK